jgi:hypothetical protein
MGSRRSHASLCPRLQQASEQVQCVWLNDALGRWAASVLPSGLEGRAAVDEYVCTQVVPNRMVGARPAVRPSGRLFGQHAFLTLAVVWCARLVVARCASQGACAG